MENKNLKKKNGAKGLRRIDPATTIIPFAAILVLCVFFIADPEGSTNVLSAIRNFLGDTFGTYYLVIGLGVLAVSLWIADRKSVV